MFRNFVWGMGVLALLAGVSHGDTVQLLNGDKLTGDVRSLDSDELTIASENFGELKISRNKIKAIYLGDAAPPEAVAQHPSTGQLPGAAINLNNPLLQQQLGRMLGGALGNSPELRDLQQNSAQAREGLQSLRDDFGPGPEADALDAYLRLFDLFAPPNTQQPQQPQQQQQPQPQPQPQADGAEPR